MKSVIIVRHAKSSWDKPGTPDFDRPLNDRGLHDAPMMARRLLEKKIPIDVFISSPARRAKKTAILFCTEYGLDKKSILFIPELYHASSPVFYSVIANAPATANTIAIFSHNPGITDFANSLTDVTIDDMPTCSVFAVKTGIGQWSEFQNSPKEFWFFDYPKSVLL